jgi:septum formation protein
MSKFLQQELVILASSSSIRLQLLQTLGIEFSVVPSHCDEEAIKDSFIADNMSSLTEHELQEGTVQSSTSKAFGKKSTLDLGYLLAASKALQVSQLHPKHFIIAADQLCLFENLILNKPMNHQTAVEHLHLLNGKQHQQIACLCIAKNNKILWQHHETAHLTLHQLSEETIEAYLQSEKPYDSCGAYQYESQGKWLFTEVQGSEDTILGLPLRPLAEALMSLGAVGF